MSRKQVNLKLAPELHQRALDVSRVAGQTFTEFASESINREIDRRLRGKSGDELRAVLEAHRTYRESLKKPTDAT